jgi:magnesium transporter
MVIKTLTIISVMTLPLTVITGLWGMNVELPFADFSLAFPAIIGIMATTVAVMLMVFWWRKWL